MKRSFNKITPFFQTENILFQSVSHLTFYVDFRCTIVVILAENGGGLEGFIDDSLDLAVGVDHPNDVGVFICIWLKQHDVLETKIRFIHMRTRTNLCKCKILDKQYLV